MTGPGNGEAPLRRVVIGTRGSALARTQARIVGAQLAAAWPGIEVVEEVVSTRGDRLLGLPLTHIGGKGAFTTELETRLRDRTIDIAVHSLKDLPVEELEDLTIGAVPRRDDWRDALISRTGEPLSGLPRSAGVGTGSPRRFAQLLRRRPDLRVLDLRGNVETRLAKLADPDGPYDAIILAVAALRRLGRQDEATEVFEDDLMLPAPGQGALAVQCARRDEVLALLRPLDDPLTAAAVIAERTFLLNLGGGCAVPVAALGTWPEPRRLRLRGRVVSLDGTHSAEVDRTVVAMGDPDRDLALAAELGAAAALDALAAGADVILSEGETK
jgi:hydroxymethylbilane synthase